MQRPSRQTSLVVSIVLLLDIHSGSRLQDAHGSARRQSLARCAAGRECVPFREQQQAALMYCASERASSSRSSHRSRRNILFVCLRSKVRMMANSGPITRLCCGYVWHRARALVRRKQVHDTRYWPLASRECSVAACSDGRVVTVRGGCEPTTPRRCSDRAPLHSVCMCALHFPLFMTGVKLNKTHFFSLSPPDMHTHDSVQRRRQQAERRRRLKWSNRECEMRT